MDYHYSTISSNLDDPLHFDSTNESFSNFKKRNFQSIEDPFGTEEEDNTSIPTNQSIALSSSSMNNEKRRRVIPQRHSDSSSNSALVVSSSLSTSVITTPSQHMITKTSFNNKPINPVDILNSMYDNIPMVVQSMTQMQAYSDHVNGLKSQSCPFPFPTINGKVLPTLFFSEPAILGLSIPTTTTLNSSSDGGEGINSNLRALIPLSKELKCISEHVQIHASEGGSIALANLDKIMPHPDALSKGLSKVTDIFKQTTITSSERFVASFMESILAFQISSGLLLTPTALISAVEALADGTGVQVPSRMSEDIRRLVNTLSKQKDDYRSDKASTLRQHEERINVARNKATQQIVAVIKNFMNELDEIRGAEVHVVTGLLSEELQFRKSIEELIQHADTPSHQLPNYLWLKTRNVLEPEKCNLTSQPIANILPLRNHPAAGEHYDKRDLFVSSILSDGSIRVCLYKPLVQEILYRGMYGTSKYGELPPQIDLSDYGGVLNSSGLCKYIKNPTHSIISRRPEDQLSVVPIVTFNDVLSVLQDPKVAPWWKFVQTFSLYQCEPNKFPDQKKFKQILESFNGQISDNKLAILLSKYEATKLQTNAGCLATPSGFKSAYGQYLLGNRDPFVQYKTSHHQFFVYFDALKGLLKEILQLIFLPSFQMKNLNHV